MVRVQGGGHCEVFDERFDRLVDRVLEVIQRLHCIVSNLEAIRRTCQKWDTETAQRREYHTMHPSVFPGSQHISDRLMHAGDLAGMSWYVKRIRLEFEKSLEQQVFYNADRQTLIEKMAG